MGDASRRLRFRRPCIPPRISSSYFRRAGRSSRGRTRVTTPFLLRNTTNSKESFWSKRLHESQ